MKFHRIKGDVPQNVIRLPRLGKLRLGIKAKTASGKEYPKETNYFVIPPELQKLYGTTPKLLPVMLPVEDEEMFMTQSYRCYGSNQKLKCHGDGEKAERRNTKGQMEEIPCPSPAACDFAKQFGCRARIDLMVVLPDYNLGGVWQLSSGSVNTDIDLRSGIEMAKYLFGRISWVPMTITREERKIPDPDTGKMMTHWPVKLYPQANVAEVNQIRSDSKRILDRQERFSLPEPVIEGEFTPEETEGEVKETEPAAPAEKESPPEAKPKENGASRKEAVLDEVRSLMSGEDVEDFLKNMNSKIKGLKASEALEISRELNKRKREIAKLEA